MRLIVEYYMYTYAFIQATDKLFQRANNIHNLYCKIFYIDISITQAREDEEKVNEYMRSNIEVYSNNMVSILILSFGNWLTHATINKIINSDQFIF